MTTDQWGCPRCRRPYPYQAEAFNGPYCECPPPPPTIATDTTTMTTPHDQAIRQAAEKIIPDDFSIGYIEFYRERAVPILRDLVAKVCGEGEAYWRDRVHDICNAVSAGAQNDGVISRVQDMAAQLTAAQAEAKLLTLAVDAEANKYASACANLKAATEQHEAEVKRLREERDEARKNLGPAAFGAGNGIYNICLGYHPENNEYEWLRVVPESDLTALRAAAVQAKGALEFYGNKKHFADVRGSFVDNCEHRFAPDGAIVEHGEKARSALTALSAVLEPRDT
jgi:hypothetical protein